jgi:hypothetical protein
MPERKYWLDLFTGKTWEEVLKNSANVSGFRERIRRTAQKIHPGDYLICNMTGISRIIGILEVKSECYVDKTPLWEDPVFPIRFVVKLIQQLFPKTAFPIHTNRDYHLFHTCQQQRHSFMEHFLLVLFLSQK